MRAIEANTLLSVVEVRFKPPPKITGDTNSLKFNSVVFIMNSSRPLKGYFMMINTLIFS